MRTFKDFPIVEDRVIDFAEAQGNARMIADNILANQKVLYIGHAIAAVAALNPHVAEAALNLIQVDYEVLPPVLDVREAMKPDAPLLHEHLTTRFRVERTGPGQDAGEGNIAGHIQFQRGDRARVPGGRCHRTGVHHPDSAPGVHRAAHVHRALGAGWPCDHLDQHPGIFNIRSLTAAILRMPESQIKVIPLRSAAAGRQGYLVLDPVVTVLSKKSGRPVKITMTRKEVFEGRTRVSHLFALQNRRDQQWPHHRRPALPGL